MPVVFRVNVPEGIPWSGTNEGPGGKIKPRVPAGGTGKTPCAGPDGRITNEKLPKLRSVAVYVPLIVWPTLNSAHSTAVPRLILRSASGGVLSTRTVTTLL